MNTALFSYKRDVLKPGGLLSGKPELFAKLEEREVRPVVSLQGETAFLANQVEVNRLITDSTVESIGRTSLDSVGVVVNRLTRPFHMDEMPQEWQDSMPTVVNDNEFRLLAAYKDRVQTEILDPLGLGIPTRLIQNPVDIAIFMQEHPSTNYVVKPSNGMGGQGVRKLQANEVLEYVADNDGFGTLIIQEAYNFNIPFPASIKSYDRKSDENFDIFSKSNHAKEIRMYGFYSPEQTSVFPVGRSIHDGTDNWFFVDPDSLPEKLTEDTKSILSRGAKLTGSKGIYAAFDIAYGNTENEEPDFHAIELNGRVPYMVGYDKHPGVADELRTRFADQIQQITNHKNGNIQE